MAIFPYDFLSEDFLILQLKEGKKEEEREGMERERNEKKEEGEKEK